MREFTTATVCKANGKWRGIIRYHDVFEDIDPETGAQRVGEWKQLTKTFEVRSRPGKNDNTGKTTAENLLSEWLEEVKRAEAEREREERDRALTEAARRNGPGLTVAEYVQAFIDENAPTWQPSTTSGHRTSLKRLIAPYIGNVRISDLTPVTVAQWRTSLTKDHGYKEITTRKALVLLKAAMKQAVERDILPKDPTRTVKPPKYTKERPNALDATARGQVLAFIDIDPTSPALLGVRLALYTGMREGEICALRWKNVDTKSRTLRVCASIGRASKGDVEQSSMKGAAFSGLYMKEPKNASSGRVISYPEEVAHVLEKRRAELKEQCLAAGVPYSPDMFVLGTVDGSPMHPHTLWWRWNAAVTALGLVGTEGKPPTFHDLRHTYATAAIASGVDVKTVSNSMGHTNAAMTLNTYATADPDAARRAAETMAETYKADAEKARGRGIIVRFDPTGTEGR